MPAARYAGHWRRMKAFALPSFYDGRVRINLAGRERDGCVAPEAYDTVCDEVASLLDECVEPRTDRPVVAEIIRASGDPAARGASEADLIILWRHETLGFDHPRLGRIGPLPYRRTGGHTGGDGIACFAGPAIRAASAGRRSAFDVVPTVIDLLGETAASPISGNSFLHAIAREETARASS
jgi:predicted AlkP superfamily phosphohydrolase/phosphomutase